MWGCLEQRVCSLLSAERPSAVWGGGMWIAESLGPVDIRRIKTKKGTLVAGAFWTVIEVLESLYTTVSLAQALLWTETDPYVHCSCKPAAHFMSHGWSFLKYRVHFEVVKMEASSRSLVKALGDYLTNRIVLQKCWGLEASLVEGKASSRTQDFDSAQFHSIYTPPTTAVDT